MFLILSLILSVLVIGMAVHNRLLLHGLKALERDKEGLRNELVKCYKQIESLKEDPVTLYRRTR